MGIRGEAGLSASPQAMKNEDNMSQIPRVAIVTGAGSGIGKATAKALAKLNYSVVCFDLANGAPTAAEINEEGGAAVDFAGDVSNSDDWAAVVELAAAQGGAYALANVAGYHEVEDTVLSFTESQFGRLISVNLHGPLLGMRAVLPGMMERRSGKIINVSSGVTLMGVPNHAAYTASKGGIDSLTRQAAIEYGSYNIQINCVVPGAVNTQMMRHNTDEINAIIQQGIPAKRVGEPEEIAAAIAFLASPASNYVNGVLLPVDGGLTAG